MLLDKITVATIVLSTVLVGRLNVASYREMGVLLRLLNHKNQSEKAPQQAQERQQKIREMTLRALEGQPAAEKQDQRLIMAMVEKVREDFRRIQIVRNEMVRNLTTKERLDYRLIARKVSEVNRRAQGLKERLFAPSPMEDPKDHGQPVEYTKEQIKEPLIKLCNLIYHFVDSPAFGNADVTEASHEAKATADLLAIIELSSNIRKSIEKLNK